MQRRVHRRRRRSSSSSSSSSPRDVENLAISGLSVSRSEEDIQKGEKAYVTTAADAAAFAFPISLCMHV